MLDEGRSHYLVRVLRLPPGHVLEVFDGAGGVWSARIESADPKRCVLALLEPATSLPEAPVRLTLAQGLCAADKMDWVVEKAVELGVHEIVPLACSRSQVRLDATRAQRRHEHWMRIIEAACMQSGRAVLPLLQPLVTPARWLETLPPQVPLSESQRCLALDPGAERTLSTIGLQDEPRPTAVSLLVGPEAGFDDAELEQAQAAGAERVKLGPRTLRTETAGLAALAAVQALAGDY